MAMVDLSRDDLVVLQDDLYERGLFVMKYRGPIDQVYLYGDRNRSRIIIPTRGNVLNLYMGVLKEGIEFQEGGKVREADLVEIHQGQKTLPLDAILRRVEAERASLRLARPSTPSAAQRQ